MVAGKLPAVPRYRQKVRFVPLRPRPAGVGRRPALQPRLSPPAHRARGAGRRPGAAQPRRPGHVATARPAQAALGDVDRRGTRARPLGAGFEGAPLHGRRRLGHRPPHGRARFRARARATDAPTPGTPSPNRATVRLVRDAIVDLVASPYEQLRAVRSATRAPRQMLQQLGELARGLRAWTGVVRPTPSSSLNGPIGPHRRWDWARTTLADVKTVRHAARRHRQRRRAHRAHARFPRLCCSRVTRASRVASCGRWCRCRCAPPANAARTTIACRR